MIWFFIAGWIGGVIFMIMYAHYWVKKHMKITNLPPLNEENNDEQKNIP